MGQNSRTEQALAASLASATVALTMTPLDVIKVRQQINSRSKVKPIAVLSSVVKNEGATALWAGLAPRLALGSLFAGLYFPMYEALRDNITKTLQKTSEPGQNVQHISAPLAGGCARLISVIVTNPVEVATVRLQADSSQKFMNMLVRKVMADPKIYFAGVGQTIMRDVPFSMIYWGLNEPLKNDVFSKPVFQPYFGPFLKSFCAGAAAGCISAVVTHPFDVLKTKLQTADGSKTSVSVTGVLRREGIASLYAGIKPRCFRVSGSCAIMLGIYEKMKDVMKVEKV